MRPADRVDRVHGDSNAQSPSRCDHDPAGVVALGFLEEHIGNNAIAEYDQNHGAEKFRKEWSHIDGMALDKARATQVDQGLLVNRKVGVPHLSRVHWRSFAVSSKIVIQLGPRIREIRGSIRNLRRRSRSKTF
jgi:hypothetical protein